jgi:hypothetical protein
MLKARILAKTGQILPELTGGFDSTQTLSDIRVPLRSI